jgi:Flp pilus assembly protein CpaB
VSLHQPSSPHSGFQRRDINRQEGSSPLEPPETLAGVSPRAGVLFGRRKALPNGRAILGGFLVAAAASIVFVSTLAGHRHGSSAYAVATTQLAAGAVIAPGDTATADIQLPGSSAASAFSDPASLVGRTLVANATPGELVQNSMLAPEGTTPGLRPVSVSVDPDSVEGLEPGDSVDVLMVPSSSSETGSTSATVDVVARGASLIAIGSSGGSSIGSSETTLVTLGVGNLSEVEALVGASHSGVVAFVKAEPSDGTGAGAA